MYQFKISFFFYSLTLGLIFISPVQAIDVNITKKVASVKTAHNGEIVKIQRIQDQHNVLTGGYTKTSRKCPPFCIQPLEVSSEVKTVGELEVLSFIQNKLNKGVGVLVDARTETWFKKSTIPGSINIPFNTFAEEASDLVKVSALAKLGVTAKIMSEEKSLIETMMSLIQDDAIDVSDKWDFSKAKEVVLWCNGVWCGQSPRAIQGMLALGFPANKIYYYRGGMQSWQSLGLTVVE